MPKKRAVNNIYWLVKQMQLSSMLIVDVDGYKGTWQREGEMYLVMMVVMR